MKIHIKRGVQDFGPYSPIEFQNYLSNSTIMPTDLVWHEGLTDWISATDLSGQLNEPDLPPVLTQATASEPKKILGMKKSVFWGASGCLLFVVGFIGLVLIAILIEEPDSESSVNIPKYEIVSSGDANYAIYKRKTFRIRVDELLKAPQLQQIAQKIIDQTTKNEDVDAAMFYFYLPDTEVEGPHTAGSVVWGPDGKWGNEDSSLPHSFIVTTGGSFDGQISTLTAGRLTAQVRRSIFENLIKAERQARKEAEAQFPNNLDMEQEVFTSKSEAYKSKIVIDNNLSKDELRQIIGEGIRKNWSPPIE